MNSERCSLFRGVFLARAATLKKLLFVVFRLDSKGAEGCKTDKGCQELPNEYLLVKSAPIQPRTSPAKLGSQNRYSTAGSSRKCSAKLAPQTCQARPPRNDQRRSTPPAIKRSTKTMFIYAQLCAVFIRLAMQSS